MSKRSRLNRPNVAMIEYPDAIVPENLPRPLMMHPCGLCMKGGGTLKKVPTTIGTIVHKGSKIRVEVPLEGKKHLYEHTSPRFCQGLHLPKRIVQAVVGAARRESSRQAQEFHATGRNAQKRSLLQRRTV